MKIFFFRYAVASSIRLLTKFLPVAIAAVSTGICNAQVQRYPANVNPVVAAPYSVYLSDYIDPASRKFVANVLFNDFNEPSWTFKLKLRIEGMDLALETSPDFSPATPITVQPGVPYTLAGLDWAEYFDFDNLLVRGRHAKSITTTGRLPEGTYSFCLQVLDFATGDPLSEEICQTIWLQLMDPPRTISPACATYIDPLVSTQVPFTWQLVNTISPNDVLGTQYRLTLWEVTEAGANPLSAVANGQALQVFQSDLLQAGNFIYGPSEPLLETGKLYVYQIQALDPDGKDRFKNNGKSEFCYFYYGWPVGGKIAQLSPADGQSFRSNKKVYLKWSVPDNKAPHQAINYEVTVKEFEDGQTAEDALLENPIWYYRLHEPSHYNNSHNDQVPYPSPDKRYSWQIKAFTNGTEVAQSGISTFQGPPMVEQFFAGPHSIEVDEVTVKDMNNLAGTGRIRLQKGSPEWTSFTFAGLKLVDNAGMLYLDTGRVFIETDPIVFNLNPVVEENGEAEFEVSRFVIDKRGLNAEGVFTWDLPFSLLSGNKAKVRSKVIASDFNYFTVTADVDIAEGSTYELLDPYGFTLSLSASSLISINNNNYSFTLHGTVSPGSVRTTSGDVASWAFADQEQLFLMTAEGLTSSMPLRVIPQTTAELVPTLSVIDLSDNRSPDSRTSDPYWKGIHIAEYDITLKAAFDNKGQLLLNRNWSAHIVPDQAGGSMAWIGPLGLNLKEQLYVDRDSSYFNTFQSTITRLHLDISNSNVNPGTRLYGNFLVPFINSHSPFAFEVPVDNTGFKTGFLTNINGTTFRFNPEGGELAVDITVKKAELVSDHLKMTLDVRWPSLGIELLGVPNFAVWGNHTIGFFKPEGIAALSTQVNATFRGYPVTIDVLSAGRNRDYYGLAVSGKVVMGDDISGDDGPPAFNLYSLVQNPLLSADYTPASTQTAFRLEDNSGTEEMEAELAALEESLTGKIAQQAEGLETTTEDLITSASAGLGGQEFAIEEMVPLQEEETVADYETIEERKAKLIALLQLWRSLAENPTVIDEMIEQINNSEEDFDNVSDLVAELKKYAISFATDQVASLGDGFLRKVDNTTHAVNSRIIGEINKLTETVHQQLDQAVGNIISTASADVIASLTAESPDAGLVVQQIATATKEAIVNECVVALNTSVNQNVVFPVTSFVSRNLSERAHRLVQQTAETVVLAAFNADQSPSEAMKEVLNGFEDELQALGDELAGQVDLNKALETTKKLGQDIVVNISAQRIVNKIKQGAAEAVAGMVAARAADAAADLLNKALGDQLDIAIPIDFGAAGARLLAGGNPKDLLFDPIPIKVRSPTLDLNGIIHFAKGNPQYGDMFAGNVTATVKVPSPFEIQVAYMNGRKDGLSFWMAEVGTPTGDQENGPPDISKIGQPMTKGSVKETTNKIELGVVKIMALQGRVYQHMSADGLAGITPDASNKYGAYLYMVGYGPQNGRMLRMEIDASMNVGATGDYTVAFNGNAQLLSKNPKVNAIDETAIIQGTVTLSYNSAEKHFLGLAAAVFEQPGVLCAEGNLLVDVKPGAWRVALGNRDERLSFILNCAGFGPTGWLDLNQNTGNLGLGLEFMFRPDPIAINLSVAKLALLIEAGAAAGIQVTAQYNPSFELMEAGLWLEIYARILLSYEMGLKKGNINLVDIFLSADANMRFKPAPTMLYGEVDGHIRVLVFDFNFNKQFQMNM